MGSGYPLAPETLLPSATAHRVHRPRVCVRRGLRAHAPAARRGRRGRALPARVARVRTVTRSRESGTGRVIRRPISARTCRRASYRGLGDLLIDGQLSRTNARKVVVARVAIPRRTGRPVFVDFSAAAVYPPVPYVPSAIGIRVGRLFGASPFVARAARAPRRPRRVHRAASRSRSGGCRRARGCWRSSRSRRSRCSRPPPCRPTSMTTALALLVIADALALDGAPGRRRAARRCSSRPCSPRSRSRCASSRTSSPPPCCSCPRGGTAGRSARAIGATLAVGGVLALGVDALGERPLPRARLPAAVARRPRRTTRTTTCSRRAQLAYLRSHPFAFVERGRAHDHRSRREHRPRRRRADELLARARV